MATAAVTAVAITAYVLASEPFGVTTLPSTATANVAATDAYPIDVARCSAPILGPATRTLVCMMVSGSRSSDAWERLDRCTGRAVRTLCF
ncbi:hypothetical protein WK02_23585 [Burkholderia cepacia]|nr:hypothetical protein WJ46_05755 [Burkholderia cepacia]KVQ27658.1 hypothetical protein WK02_23585 [Burkholderia cepacia]